MDSWRPGCSGGSWEINEQASLSYSLNWGLSRKVNSCLCHLCSIASFAHVEGFGLRATITAEFKALTHTIQLRKATPWYVYQCNISSSASVTLENRQLDLQSNGSPALRFSSFPCRLSTSPPVPLHYLPAHGASSPWMDERALKGSLGFYFCSLCGLLHITVPPQQDWPHGSNTLTAHKQQQGLQMTTCHWPGPSHLQLTKHFQ